MKVGKIGEMRLMHVLSKDKKENQSEMLEFLKRDLCNILENYMSISDIDLKMQVSGNEYVLLIQVNSPRFKSLGLYNF